jgi:hypothetical protein
MFGDLFWSLDLMTFLVFSCPCFYQSCNHGKWCPDVSKKKKGAPESHLVDGNAQIEKLRSGRASASGSRVRRAGKHVKSNKMAWIRTLGAYMIFVKFDTKDCQNGSRFSQHFTMISNAIFKR